MLSGLRRGPASGEVDETCVLLLRRTVSVSKRQQRLSSAPVANCFPLGDYTSAQIWAVCTAILAINVIVPGHESRATSHALGHSTM